MTSKLYGVAIAAIIMGCASNASAQRGGGFGGHSVGAAGSYARAGAVYHNSWHGGGAMRSRWDALAGPRWRSPIVVDTLPLPSSLPLIDGAGYGDPCLFRTHYGWIPSC